jgi:hypothetical protein
MLRGVGLGSEVNLRVDENDTFAAHIEAHVPE